jgi:hypothetical protein
VSYCVGAGQVRDSALVRFGPDGKISQGFECLLLEYCACGMKKPAPCAVTCDSHKGKVGFEVGPCFVGCVLSMPVMSCIGEEAGLEDCVVDICYDLCWCVSSIGGGSKFDGFFILIEENFGGLERIISFFHSFIIFDQVSWVDVAVGYIKMCGNV